VLMEIPCPHGFYGKQMCPHRCHNLANCTCEPSYIAREHIHKTDCPSLKMPSTPQRLGDLERSVVKAAMAVHRAWEEHGLMPNNGKLVEAYEAQKLACANLARARGET